MINTTMSAIHARAVRESCDITRTQWRLMKKKMPAKIDLYRILRTLTDKKTPFVLTGAHALGGWTGEPRATKDIDILVKPGRNQARAVNAIHGLYPHLEIRHVLRIVRFHLPGENWSAIDITVPFRRDIEETLAHPVWVEERGLRYRIPSLECALANKYGAMLTLERNPAKRLQDAADFTKMVQRSLESGGQPVDLERLQDLGDLIWSEGGGAELLSLVEQVRRGEVVNLHSLMG
jgi:hypothetical protein